MFVTPAYAQAVGEAPSGGNIAVLVGQFVLLGAIFWFLIIRPQQKRMKEHREKIGAVKKGDSVVTGGGVIGKVTKVEENEVEVEIASSVRIRVVKATLTDVQPLGGAKPAND